jgi:gamma-glutamyltranspeptidase/glutathione hydrolase
VVIAGKNYKNVPYSTAMLKRYDAVAVTTTINSAYGNGQVVPGAGFLLNNEMDDFASKPGTPNMFGLVQGERNAIAPGKRPLSSMTPTMLLKDGKLFMTVGAPGGSRISTAVLQVILNQASASCQTCLTKGQSIRWWRMVSWSWSQSKHLG